MLCAWLGYYTTFTGFAGWDDEGELLITVKDFAHHGGLYTHIYSSFGPFYYEAFSTIFSWLPVTLDNGRVATLVVTLLASLGFGVAIQMFTRNVLAGVAMQVSSFVLLILSFVYESMHPMILVWLLLAVALIALALVARGHRSVGYVVLGATVAALVLTVVNVGAFAAIALLFTGLTLAPPVRRMRLPRAAAAVLFVATPVLIILVGGGHVTDSWADKYSLVVALAAAGVVVVTYDRRLQGLVGARDAARFLLGGAVLGALVVAIALLSGTRPEDLVRGLFIDPARFSTAFTIPIALPWGVVGWGAACLAGAVLYRRYRNQSSPPGLLDAWVHVAVGLVILYIAVAQGQIHSPISISFTVALPLLFFTAVPPVGATESERVARVAVVALAVLEGLLAYPVDGAQGLWSSVLIVPPGLFCLHDGMRQLSPGLVMARRHGRRVATGLLASVVLVGGLGWLGWVFGGNLSWEANGYHADSPVTLAGSNMIRLPAGQIFNLEFLSAAIRAQCSTFVTVPAMNSLYFWTGESPPATNWTNTWFDTSDGPLQKQVLNRIKGQDGSRFCVVDNPKWTYFWYQGHVIPQLPLARLVERFRREHGPPEPFGGYYDLFVSHGSAP